MSLAEELHRKKGIQATIKSRKKLSFLEKRPGGAVSFLEKRFQKDTVRTLHMSIWLLKVQEKLSADEIQAAKDVIEWRTV